MVEEFVWVRRQRKDYRQAKYRLEDLRGVHWSDLSGGVRQPAPHYFLHAYVMCDGMVDGNLAHSCQHGTGPHQVKVCITRKGNEAAYEKLSAQAGPKPLRPKKHQCQAMLKDGRPCPARTRGEYELNGRKRWFCGRHQPVG